MVKNNASLPDTVGSWKTSGPPRVITADTIFDYMNGGGELYLAYHFDQLLVHEYKDNTGNDILVELYTMKSADDAFGLLSLDWGGEAIELFPAEKKAAKTGTVPAARALYGAGLLRLCSGKLYARVMSFRETSAARDAVLELGQAIASGRGGSPVPRLLNRLPLVLAPGWRVLPERTAWFRSHLVLNSLYYLSHENILRLEPDCEAAMGVYERDGERIHLLIILYAQAEKAQAALKHFLAAYVPEQDAAVLPATETDRNFFQVEDGWLGSKLKGRGLVLAFGCPERQSAREVLFQVNPGT